MVLRRTAKEAGEEKTKGKWHPKWKAPSGAGGKADPAAQARDLRLARRRTCRIWRRGLVSKPRAQQGGGCGLGSGKSGGDREGQENRGDKPYAQDESNKRGKEVRKHYSLSIMETFKQMGSGGKKTIWSA